MTHEPFEQNTFYVFVLYPTTTSPASFTPWLSHDPLKKNIVPKKSNYITKHINVFLFETHPKKKPN